MGNWTGIQLPVQEIHLVSTSQSAVMLCGWGVKAGMVREWVAGKTVIPLLSRAISEHH